MKKILIVDDVADVRNTIKGFLEDHDYAVWGASNEGEALGAIIQESFDYAFIDVRLHGDDTNDESGLSLAMAIRSLDDNIIIILMTGFEYKSELVVRAIQYYGAVDFVEKGQEIAVRILETLEKPPTVIRPKDEIRLAISLSEGEPIYLRVSGKFVRAARTRTILRLDDDHYARRIEIARQNQHLSLLRFQVQEIGRQLWSEIFKDNGEVYSIYFDAKGRSELLTLHFETPRKFIRLPIEFMRSSDPDEYLVLRHPLSRFIMDAVVEREAMSPTWFAKTKRLRVLLIASNTEPKIPGADQEIDELQKFFKRLRNPPTVTVLPTEKATYQRVKNILETSTFDIIHYAGHGWHEPISPEESHLTFWQKTNKQGQLVPMKATELAWLLRESQVRLVYLSGCYGMASEGEQALLDDDYLGLADAIVMAGVPTVMGFRWPVIDNRAKELALAFYKVLFEQGSPEIALWRARQELAAKDLNDPAWLSPILIHQK